MKGDVSMSYLLIAVLLCGMALVVHASDITDLPDQEERAELPPDGGEEFNALIHSSSPYLLQHARNPVDWYEWGERAFAVAKEEDKPIFLSVGYSTCHWCHVMARESFEDDGIAEILNEHFVSVKLDREERPDIDQIYMTYVQAINQGRGGWPMSVFLTPEREPFYGGTYFPRDRFAGLLQAMAKAWKEQRDEIEKASAQAVGGLRQMAASNELSGDLHRSGVMRLLTAELGEAYDKEYGGFGRAPKFPRPVSLIALLHHHYRSPGRKMGEKASAMATGTLRAMAMGGMYDHLGGGFHRYSVDRFWHVPHFEKMLYDQGQLAEAYAIAAIATGDDYYARVAADVCDYVIRDLTHEDGGFFSAEDADSRVDHDAEEYAEGAFYVWKKAEILEVLGEEEGALICEFFGVEADGNAPDGSDPMREFVGENILIQRRGIPEFAANHDLEPETWRERLAAARAALFERREQRPRPHLDDKVLTAWNGLMIAGMARTHLVTGEAKYRDAARAAAAFVRERLYDPETGNLYRVWRDGRGETPGFAVDYAFLVAGLIDCYQADPDPVWLRWAVELQDRMNEAFWDDANHGWYETMGRDETVIVRIKEGYDGAEPSANSIAAQNCVRLAHLVDREDLLGYAEKTLAAFSQRLEGAPNAVPALVAAWDLWVNPPPRLVIAAGEDFSEGALRSTFHRNWVPGAGTLCLLPGSRDGLTDGKPWLAAMEPADDGARSRAYLCQGRTCQAPTTDPGELAKQIEALPRSATSE